MNTIGWKKSQHTVPAFYLRNFSVDDKRSHIFRLNRDGLHVKRTAIKKATVVENIYTQFSHSDPMVLENAFGNIESQAAPAIRKLVNGDNVSDLDRESIAYFIAAQLKRTTLVNDRHLQEVAAVRNPEVVVRYVERARKRLERKVSAKELDKFIQEIQSGLKTIELSPQELMANSQHRIRDYAEAVMEMSWHVFHTKTDAFVTSDNPAFVRRRGFPFDPGIVGIDRQDLDSVLYVPLSTRYFLTASWRRIREPRVATYAKVRELNRLVVLCSNDNVLGSQIDSSVVEFAMTYKGFRIGFPSWSAEEIADA